MTDDVKRTWGPLAYLRGAVKVIPDLTHYRTRIRLDDQEFVEVPAVNVIVANGKTAGGGTVVAPTADPCDGLLDVVVVHAGTNFALAGVAARLLAGDYTNSDIVSHDKVRSAEIHSEPGMWFNVDGELLTQKPVRFRVIPASIRVIVGPTFGAMDQK
jgi:diacylglycerol kinase (ATP)